LTSRLAPLLSRDELAIRLEEFAAFLQEHRDHLVQTGLPPRKFGACPWLHVQLGRLYDTRATESPYSVNEILPDRTGDELAYLFIRRPPGFHTHEDYEFVPYEDADFWPGLAPEDAGRLEDLRPLAFQATLEVVQYLAQQPDPAVAADAALEKPLSQLGQENFEFLRRMDQWYLGADTRPGSAAMANPQWSPGGISNILEVVGRYVAAHRIGAFHHASLELGPLLRAARDAESEDVTGPAGYFSLLLMTGEASELNGALDRFVSEQREEKQFWAQFNAQIDAGATNLAAPPEAAPGMESSPSPRFSRSGGTWTISYGGGTHAANDRVGYFYLSVLLGKPKEPFEAAELRRLHRATQIVGRARSGNPEDLGEGSSDLGEVLDEEGQNSYQARITRLRQESETAKRRGQVAMRREHDGEIAQIESALAKSRTPRGAPRRLADPAKRDWDAVKNAIDRAVEKIQGFNPALHLHLQVSLKFAKPWISYAPDPPVEWVT
ncbi:MAG TPA: hypothetical protein PKC18_20140, partial [Lacipirellulaceae bacterium]|nr:hypothetical protein [Lacipirellulaceae bacterium]